MDFKANKWNLRVELSGVAETMQSTGSLNTLLPELVGHLKTHSPRQLSGSAEVVIRIRDVPFDTETKESLATKHLIDSFIFDVPVQRIPKPGETYEQYYDYLINEFEADERIARHTANEFFDRDTGDFKRWMNDPKAERLRLLTGSSKHFESATPSEYSELKQYVIAEFPEYAKNITFRTAN